MITCNLWNILNELVPFISLYTKLALKSEILHEQHKNKNANLNRQILITRTKKLQAANFKVKNTFISLHCRDGNRKLKNKIEWILWRFQHSLKLMIFGQITSVPVLVVLPLDKYLSVWAIQHARFDVVIKDKKLKCLIYLKT